MQEIKILRKPREKHYRNNDGTFTVEMYDQNIHYLKNNEYQEINNTLILKDKYITNKDNDFKVHFARNKEDTFLLQILKDQYYLNINLANKNISYNLDNNKMTYLNILNNIDIEYIVKNEQIKDNIILKQKNNDFKNLKYKIETNLELELKNGNLEIQKVFTLKTPTLIDKNNNTYPIQYHLTKENNSYTLSFIIDETILNNESLYPLIIDPIMQVNSEESVYDTYICNGEINKNYNSEEKLIVGTDPNGKTYRTLMKFNLPNLGTGCDIIDARAYLTSHPELIETGETHLEGGELTFESKYLEKPFDVHAITTNWTEETANWNSMNNKYETKIENFTLGMRAYETSKAPLTIELRQTELNITNLVKQWYAGFPNYGFMIKQEQETYEDKYREYYFYSKNNNETIDGQNPRPYLILHYRNQNGLNDYMTYQTIEFDGGVSFINNLTGNVLHSFHLLNTKGNYYPINLALNYNTNDRILNKNFGLPKGFKFNYYETLQEVNFDHACLEYIDGTGATHYFYEHQKEDTTTEIIDEDGLGLTATKNETTYTLTDKNGNKKEFVEHLGSSTYFLYKIMNTNNEYLDFYYNESELAILKNRKNQRIQIDSLDRLRITISDENLENSTLELSNGEIEEIVTNTGVTKLTYNDKNLIETIEEASGKKYRYTYYDTLPYRIKTVEELGINGEVGNRLEFTYEFKVTRVKDNKGRITSYTFNNQGNTICTTSLDETQDIRNAYGKISDYDTGARSPKSKNKLISLTEGMKYTNNLLTDTSFEKGTYPSEMITTEEKRSGDKSLKITGEYTLSLPKVKENGFYTFSAYFKTTNNFKIALYETSLLKEEKMYQSSSEFIRTSLTYELDKEKNYTIKIYSDNITDVVYMDDMQLERGETANYHNLIENSDFSNGFTGWDIPTNPNSGIVTLPNGIHACKLVSGYQESDGTGQSFIFNGKKNETYRLSFWYKNEGIQDPYSEYEGIIVLLGMGYIGDGRGVPQLVLNNHATEWQFFETILVAEEDFDSMWLSFISQNEVNSFYFTNVCLTKYLENNSFAYDDNGNLTVAYNQNKGISEFNYDDNNQLISSFEPKGNNFSFEYDSKNRLVEGISTKGIANKMEYDENNNPIKTKIFNTKIANEISYYIRLKGTNKLLSPSYLDMTPKFESPKCSNDCFDILYNETNHSYTIKSNIIPRFLNIKENSGRLETEKTTEYEQIKNKNGSVSFKIKGTENCLTEQNNTLITQEYAENNEHQEFYLEPFTSRQYLETSAKYKMNGKFLKETVDHLGKVTDYNINPFTGELTSITDPKGTVTTYTYTNNRKLAQVSKNNKEINYTYNTNELLDKITCNNKEYHFTYDNFLNTKKIKINDQVLVTNNYEEQNGNLINSIYGNNHKLEYTYDEFDRIKKLKKNNKSYTYYYNNLSELVKVKSEDTYNYFYDLARRLSRYEFNNHSIDYDYDINNNVTKKIINFNGVEKTIEYTYDEDDSIIRVTLDNDNLNYNYDELGRLKTKNISNHLPIYYDYYSNGNKTSLILKSMKIENDLYEYLYDDLYNITEIYKNKENFYFYIYDNDNQLIESNNYQNNKKYKYTYDDSGNILKKEIYNLQNNQLLKIDTYEYNNLNWKDQLTKYNDTSITYDEIGNPLTIGNKTLSWNIRELKSMMTPNINIEYEYNKDGIRKSKTVNGIETKYFTENSAILFEQTGAHVLYYIRDDNNNLIGFKTNNTTYYYKKNYQNDIIGIYDNNYNLIVSYEYDDYGSILSIKDNTGIEITDPNHIGNINPFRYRSYYYDKETNLYYLNSRYYNPEWGRFINADSIIGTKEDHVGYNLYSYCENNPINRTDSDGNSAILAGTAVISCGFNSISNPNTIVTGSTVANIANKNKTVTNNQNSMNKSQNKNKKPLTSEPNSVYTAPNGDKRVFGPDGKSLKDIDYSHPSHHPELENPHVHDWDWSKTKSEARSKVPRNPYPGELDNLFKVVSTAGAGYLIYRGIRMIGSFIPWMWWSIPINAITP